MVQYSLDIVSSIPDPFDGIDETDKRKLSNFQHVAEMNSVTGRNRVEYGGESPWVHCWTGSIPNVDDIKALELSEDSTAEERIEYEIDRLMTFLVTESATPSKTHPSDFEWSVYVHDSEDRNPVVNGRRVQVVWQPVQQN